VSESADTLFDVTAVDNKSARAAISSAVVRALRWTQAERATSKTYCPTVFIGNAARLSSAGAFQDRRMISAVGVLALIESERDDDALADLVAWSESSRLTLECQRVSRSRDLD
jgi:hypothetical protein